MASRKSLNFCLPTDFLHASTVTKCKFHPALCKNSKVHHWYLAPTGGDQWIIVQYSASCAIGFRCPDCVLTPELRSMAVTAVKLNIGGTRLPAGACRGIVIGGSVCMQFGSVIPGHPLTLVHQLWLSAAVLFTSVQRNEWHKASLPLPQLRYMAPHSWKVAWPVHFTFKTYLPKWTTLAWYI